MEPSYLKLWSSGKLREKARSAWEHLSHCHLCPRNCRVNRLKQESGFCRQGPKARVAGAWPHFGEEPPLSGTQGAGTVFFCGCALRCLFCQNYQISQEEGGEELELEKLAQLFLEMQNRGCHNLDLVSPTPHLPFILKALELAVPQGFRLPLVYNTHGYLSKISLALLEDVVDIYLPDMKYGDSKTAGQLSQAEDYPFYNQGAIKEMFRQVGSLKTDDQGIAYRGLLVRHLILPAHHSDTRQVLQGLADLSPKIPISLMGQYRPCFKAREVQEINRPLRAEEYAEMVTWAEPLAFEEIFIQDLSSAEVYSPDFSLKEPFGKFF